MLEVSAACSQEMENLEEKTYNTTRTQGNDNDNNDDVLACILSARYVMQD